LRRKWPETGRSGAEGLVLERVLNDCGRWLGGGQNSASVSATNCERFTLTPRVKAWLRGNGVHDFAGDSPMKNASAKDLTGAAAQTGKQTWQTAQVRSGVEKIPSPFHGERR